METFSNTEKFVGYILESFPSLSSPVTFFSNLKTAYTAAGVAFFKTFLTSDHPVGDEIKLYDESLELSRLWAYRTR